MDKLVNYGSEILPVPAHVDAIMGEGADDSIFNDVREPGVSDSQIRVAVDACKELVRTHLDNCLAQPSVRTAANRNRMFPDEAEQERIVEVLSKLFAHQVLQSAIDEEDGPADIQVSERPVRLHIHRLVKAMCTGNLQEYQKLLKRVEVPTPQE